MPVMAQTCPAVRKPFTLLSGSDKIASIAGGTVNKEVNMEKEIAEAIIPGPKASFRCCIYKERAIINSRVKLAMGGVKAMRWTGAVVSKPIAKNTISLSGFSSASDRASKGVYSIRISAPLAFTLNKSSLLPGTRIISPKEAKITFGCVANFKA